MTHRFFAWLTWQRVRVEEMHIQHPRAEAAAVSIFAVVYVLLSFATGMIIRQHPTPFLGATSFTNDATYLFGFKLGALLLFPLVAFYVRDYRVRDLLPRWSPSPRAVACATLGFAIGCLPNLWHLGRIVPKLTALPATRAALLVIVAALLPLITAAIPEEFVYRGLLQTRLEATLGRWSAVFLTAILFAAWHLPSRYLLAQGVEGHAGDLRSVIVGTGVPVLVVSLVLGWLWDRYRSLPILIAMHWGMDFLPSMSSSLGIRF